MLFLLVLFCCYSKDSMKKALVTQEMASIIIKIPFNVWGSDMLHSLVTPKKPDQLEISRGGKDLTAGSQTYS